MSEYLANEQLVELAEVASRSGTDEDRIRLWCATGLIACERIGRRWMVPEGCLPEVVRLVADGGRRPSTGDGRQVAIAAMFHSIPDADEALHGFRQDGIDTRTANTAAMALDQRDAVLLAVTVQAAHADRAVAIIEASGGALIAELRSDPSKGD